MIQEAQFNTAEELWETLSPTHDIFGDGRDRDLMYRGQRDSSMKLIPSVLRDDDPSRKLWGEKPSAQCSINISWGRGRGKSDRRTLSSSFVEEQAILW